MATSVVTKVTTPWGFDTAQNYAFTGNNTFGGTSTFNSTVGFYSTSQNFGNFYNYSNFFQYGSFYTSFPAGSIPYIGNSQELTYDADDFFRNIAQKRYGFGIGSGDTLLAKVHVVGLGSCAGTPSACSTYGDSESCNAHSPCYWGSYGSCYIFGDESSCNAQPGCGWSSGSDCSSLGDQMSCESVGSPCSWQTSYSNCSEIGDESSCNSAGGGMYCSWSTSGNTCPGYGDESSCNSNSPCSWYQPTSNCSEIFDESSCNGAGGGGYCSWNGSSCDGSTYPNGSPYCSGDNSYSYCSGSTYPSGASCTGGMYGGGCQEVSICQGTPTPCSSYSDSSACGAAPGCSWGQEPAGYFDGDVTLAATSSHKVGFYGSSGSTRQTVTGSRGGNAALASLLTALANVGIIVDSSS